MRQRTELFAGRLVMKNGVLSAMLSKGTYL